VEIWHISDTHSFHELLSVPEVDLVIHSGDFTNYHSVIKNEQEALNFLHWYGSLNIKYKLLIAGNHDSYAFSLSRIFKEQCNKYNIIYLENESVEIEGVKIFGSPITPTFGDWYFQKNRNKLERFWNIIPKDSDIVVTHGPPKTILDLSYNRFGSLEFCGDRPLLNRLKEINPKLSLFGHIHNCSDIVNAGTRTIPGLDTIFSNGSIMTDRKFGKLTSNGNIFEI